MIELSNYDVDPVRGFLPADDPLTELPEPFAPWEEMSAQIPVWLTAEKVRTMLARLDPIDPEPLTDPQQLNRAFLVLSVLANAYIMGDTEQAKILPRNIAFPLCSVAQKLQIPPVFTYFSMILYNWTRIDRNEPIALNNLAVSRSYQGSMDEHWFYLTMVDIEAKGGPAIQAIVEAQEAIEHHNPIALQDCLKRTIAAQKQMIETLKRIPEKCDPYIFYNRVRPILGAWKEPGVIYEGVGEKPQMWIAASAAQSSLLQALDIALGIHHQKVAGQFLIGMRDYMPSGHRRFLEALETGPVLRDYIVAQKNDYPALKTLYNESLELLDNFRKKHLEISVRYVVKEARKAETGVSGTSGTNVTRFLGQVRRETSELAIK